MYCRKCSYDLRNLDAHRCPECGHGFDPTDPRTWSSTEITRWRRVVSSWAAPAIVLHLMVLTLWCGYELVVGHDRFSALFLAFMINAPVLACTISAWLIGLNPGGRLWDGRKASLLTVAFCLALLASFWTRWPLHAAVAVSRPALERVATDAAGGSIPTTPVWAGVFRIEKIEQRSGHWVLWIDAHSAGPIGLVYQMPSADVPNNFNLWSHQQLNADWHIVNED